jgi:peptidoglycan-N-acetylglucosamine deacetylase
MSVSWVRQTVRAGLARLLPRRMYIVRGPRRLRTICLTFDDGPAAETTPRVLDVLAAEGARATFFVIGREAAAHPDLVRRIAAEGHALGHHSYHHSPPHQTSSAALLAEVRQSRELLQQITGQAPSLFRPPLGKLTSGKLAGLWGLRQTVVLWNRDPRDYACQSARELENWFSSSVLRGGDIVLLHDNRPFAADVLSGVIRRVRAQGLDFATLNDWLA